MGSKVCKNVLDGEELYATLMYHCRVAGMEGPCLSVVVIPTRSVVGLNRTMKKAQRGSVRVYQHLISLFKRNWWPINIELRKPPGICGYCSLKIWSFWIAMAISIKYTLDFKKLFSSPLLQMNLAPSSSEDADFTA